MREQIALTLYRIAGYTEDFETTFPHKSWANLGEKAKASWYRKADQIHKEYMAWFLSKLKPLSPEEIGNAIDLDTEYTFPRSDGSSVTTFDCRPISQASLTKFQEDLLKTLEGE